MSEKGVLLLTDAHGNPSHVMMPDGTWHPLYKEITDEDNDGEDIDERTD